MLVHQRVNETFIQIWKISLWRISEGRQPFVGPKWAENFEIHLEIMISRSVPSAPLIFMCIYTYIIYIYICVFTYLLAILIGTNMIIDNDNIMIIYWSWGVPYFQRSQCWWALVQCMMLQCKILMFLFAIRIHVEYTFPNDGFPIANHLRIQIRAVTVESSFAKSQQLAGCFTFSIYSPNRLFAYHSPCALPSSEPWTLKNPQQAVKFRFFIWHLEIHGQSLIPLEQRNRCHSQKITWQAARHQHPSAGPAVHPLWKDPPFSMGKSTISTGPFSIANCNKLPEGKPNDCWASHHFRSSNLLNLLCLIRKDFHTFSISWPTKLSSRWKTYSSKVIGCTTTLWRLTHFFVGKLTKHFGNPRHFYHFSHSETKTPKVTIDGWLFS